MLDADGILVRVRNPVRKQNLKNSLPPRPPTSGKIIKYDLKLIRNFNSYVYKFLNI